MAATFAATDHPPPPAPEPPALQDAILAIHRNLPRLEKSLSEICELKELIGELKERLSKKEQEVSEAISQNSAVLDRVFGASQESFNELLQQGKGNGIGKAKTKREEKTDGDGDRDDDDDDDACSEPETRPGKAMGDDGPEEPRVYFEADTSSALALALQDPVKRAELEMTAVVDLTIKSSKDTSSKRQASLEEALSKATRDTDLVHREIEEGERAAEQLGLSIEERRQRALDCESERATLCEAACGLERELEGIAQKYRVMNEELNGIAPEESDRILHSTRSRISQSSSSDGDGDGDVNIEPPSPRSPLLQKYAGVVSELCENAAQRDELEARVGGLRVEDQLRELCEVREKLSRDRQRVPLLSKEAKKLKAALRDSEAEARALETWAGDLAAAMRWGQSESRGLYQPSVATAPVVLLLFQLYCRQQVSFDRLGKGAMSESVTAARLRRYGCTAGGLREAGYGAREAREAGCSVSELKQGGYIVREVRESHLEEKEAEEDDDEYEPDDEEQEEYEEEEGEEEEEEGVESVLPEVSLVELLGAGYSVEELKTSGFSARELREARAWFGRFLSVAALRVGGCTASELREVGCEAEEARAGGFTVADLRTAGYSIDEILGAAFSLDELRAGLSADELTTAALMRGGRFTVQELLDAGYATAEMILSETVIVVTGTGWAADGRYTFATLFNGAGMFEMKTEYEGRQVQILIMRCLMKNNITLRWFFSIVPEGKIPGTSTDIDFYSSQVQSGALPPTTGWVSVKAGQHQPLPCLSMLRA